MLAGGFGLGWAVFSIYESQSIQGLIMLYTVLNLFALAGGIQLLRGDSFGLIPSFIFHVPQLVFWETTNYGFQFISGLSVFVKYGTDGKFALNYSLASKMHYRSGWGQAQISPEIGVNLVTLAFIVVLIVYSAKVFLNPSPKDSILDT